MAANSSIGWTDRTWNPLLGCERVSAGCDLCYAISTAHIRAGHPNPKVAAAFTGLTRRVNGRTDWTGQVNLLHERLTQPLDWPKRPALVFVNSQSDLFHDQVPDEFIAQVFAVMATTPQHTYQILTKRHARMRSLLSGDGFEQAVLGRLDWLLNDAPPWAYPQWPLPNVWLGVSVEDQRWADIRIPALLDTPAAVRWLSAEPLLGPTDIAQYLTPEGCHTHMGQKFPALCQSPSCGTAVAWVVVGGESGPGARPMDPGWARLLRNQCADAGVAFFFKQLGTRLACELGVPGKGEDFDLLPAEFQIRQYPARHVPEATHV